MPKGLRFAAYLVAAVCFIIAASGWVRGKWTQMFFLAVGLLALTTVPLWDSAEAL